ncbi:MAG: FAD:protein FMN transferase [Bacteroidales bacterium]|nr:FAD:protein FMN transferase [Bacteroidales bacterium]
MKKFVLLLIVILIIISSCSKKQTYYKLAGYAQGTTYHITYQGSQEYSTEIDSLLHNFDLSLSTYIDNSIISRINKNDTTVILDSLFIEFFNKSKEVYEQSGGAFDITVAPLVNAYGFGFSKKSTIDSALINRLMQFVGMDKVQLKDGKLIKSDKRVMLDGNAIAQGQSVDYVSCFLESKGIENYLVEIGGEIRAKGLNPEGKFWRVGIDKPIEHSDENNRELQAIIDLKDMALATSGNYRKFYEEGGVKYSHTINPKTGYPAKQSILSATIIADDCITADAYATTCMVIGLEKSKDLLKRLGNIEAYLIYPDPENPDKYKIYMTEGMKKMIEK